MDSQKAVGLFRLTVRQCLEPLRIYGQQETCHDVEEQVMAALVKFLNDIKDSETAKDKVVIYRKPEQRKLL